MKWPVHSVGLACTLAVWGLPSPGWAGPAAGATEVSAEVGVGGEYDSNVSVDELDASSNQGDYALTLDAELKLEHAFTATTDLRLSYNLDQTFYEEFSHLDRQTHLLGADLATELGPITSGLSLYYINARLDGHDFLEYYRGSPYLSGFLSKKWFVRGAYVYSDKSIDPNPARDARSHAGELDFYYFRRGLRSYFNLGYNWKTEDAEADRYDYRANDFKLRYIHRVDLLERQLKLELSWRYEDRDYSAETPSIGKERRDRRHRWKLGLEYPVLQRGVVQLYTGYADYESNYPSADYKQYIVGTRFAYRW